MAWSDNRNREFAQRVWQIAGQIRQLGLDAYVLLEIWQANGVVTDPAFVDTNGVAKDDVIAMVGILADLVAFVQNGPVPSAERELILARILGGSFQG